MRLVFLILFFLTVNTALSQELELSKYYLGDTTIKRNRVKTSIYTCFPFPHLNSISEYDKSGREVLWYYTNGGTKNHTNFLYHKDTLIQIHFTSTDDQEKSPYQIKKYVYNKKGQIIFYADSYRNSLSDKTEASFIRFFYDNSGNLTSTLEYQNNNYPFPINEYFPVIQALFKLTNVENFHFNKLSQLITKKQMIGDKDERYIDSFFYDNKKRLTKQIRFQKEGFMGEFRYGNIFYITEYSYTDSSVIEANITQHDDGFGKTYRYVEREYETVTNKNGLVDKTYSVTGQKKSLSGKNEYIYY